MTTITVTPLMQAVIDAKVATQRALYRYETERFNDNPVRMAAALATWHARLDAEHEAEQAFRADPTFCQMDLYDLCIAAYRQLQA